jgi:hypothetical protein
MRGVSVACFEWIYTPPSRPSCETYVDDMPEVITSWRGFAALWGCSKNAVRYQLRATQLRQDESRRSSPAMRARPSAGDATTGSRDPDVKLAAKGHAARLGFSGLAAVR